MMKKTFKLLTLLVVALMFAPFAKAQQEPTPEQIAQMMAAMYPQLPADSAVRIGKLPNGMTYYIRHNETPKGQADFYIAQKVGSIVEEDNQRGLAHFLEHMCFNGTKNFPGNSMIDWLETVGVKFGANLNAYTAIDETVYNISNVPVARTEVQDSCLLILHDWANDLLLDGAEIDKERGVIHEEWRSRNKGQQRILENLLPKLYPNSRYAYRMPIGTMEVVDNFPHQALRDYYEKWYRPDLQGIVVVGDIDVDRVEGKIKEIFADIEMPANAAVREYFEVPDHEGTIYAVGHDPEQRNNIVEYMILADPMPQEMKNTELYYQTEYVKRMVSAMLGNRFQEMMSKPDAPFAAAFADLSGYLLSSRTKEAVTVGGIAKDNNILPVLEATYRELLRAAKFGFEKSEYERAKNDYLATIERLYNNRNTTQTESYVNEYVRNFLDGEPIPGIGKDFEIAKKCAEMIPVEAINQTLPQLLETEGNRVVLAMLSDNKEGVYPTDAQLAEVIAKVNAEDIKPFVDNVKTEPLIANLPTPGKITGEKQLEQWGATEWTLANGARVIVKPTKFKDDEILFAAQALDGTASLGKQYIPSLIFGDYSFDNYSFGSYTNNDLTKYLAGKKAEVSFDFSDYTREVSGHATPKDLPVLMELIYSAFTQTHYDIDEFKSLQNTILGVIKNQETTPEYAFGKLVTENIFTGDRHRILSSEIVSAADAEMTTKAVKALTSNAADYTFVFVGNVDLATLRPLVEQYIATLPGNPAMSVKTVAEFHPENFVKPGSETVKAETKMAVPQTTVAIIESANLPYSSKDAKIASIVGQIMSKRLLKTVREDMGAVYSIGAAGNLGRMGLSNALIQTQFPMKPEMKDEVLKFIADEFKSMEGNITQAELDAVREYMVKNANEGKERNEGWLGAMQGWLINGVDSFNNAVDELNSITVADLQNYMKKINSQNNYRVIYQEPDAESIAAAKAADEKK